MQDPPEGAFAMDRQKGEYMAGKDNATDQGTQHGDQDQRCENRLHNPQSRVLSTEQIFDPFPVEDMMQDKQYKHTHSNPLMRRLSSNLLICH